MRSSLLLPCVLVAACQQKPTPSATTSPVPVQSAPTSSASPEAGAPPIPDAATEVPRTAVTTPRLVRASATACGGTLAAGANAQEAMVEALFARGTVGYTQDGTLAVTGTLSTDEVAAAISVRSCSGGFGGADVPSPSAYDTSEVTPADPAAWKKAEKKGAFGVLGAHAYSRVLTTLPDPKWAEGADEIRVLWVELTHRDDDLAASSGFLGIVGRYGDAIRVLASSGGQSSRPTAQRSVPIETVTGAGAFWLLLPYPDSGLTGPDDDEAWMRDLDEGEWRVAYVWKKGALKSTGVVPIAMKPNASRAKLWNAQMLSARYDATPTGLVGHEIWRTTSGAESKLDRTYVLSEAELAKSYSAKILRPTTYAPPKP